MSRLGVGWLPAALLCFLPVLPTRADDGFKGELNIEAGHAGNGGDSLDAALGVRRHDDGELSLRLMWSGASASGWSLDAAYLAEVRHGGGVALDRRRRLAFPASFVDPATTAPWRLTRTITDRGDNYAVQRLDRLAVAYSDDRLVLRIGRQALTWGGGLVFHPMDLFNPFAPDATYTAYKPGSDMVYGQWLFDSGADLQGVVLPRRAAATGRIESGQTSAGIKWHGFLGRGGRFGADLLLARDYRSQVLGFGISGSAMGAAWCAQVVPTRLADGGTRTSLLVNGQYAWTWGERNISAYVELFRNGFGVKGRDHDLAGLPAELAARLARSELFTVSRNYLAVGADMQWTPLLDLKPVLIANLDDASTLLIGQAIYSLAQDIRLTAGFQRGWGGHGSEYGGLETSAGSGIYASPARRLYARLTWYF